MVAGAAKLLNPDMQKLWRRWTGKQAGPGLMMSERNGEKVRLAAYPEFILI